MRDRVLKQLKVMVPSRIHQEQWTISDVKPEGSISSSPQFSRHGLGAGEGAPTSTGSRVAASLLFQPQPELNA